MERCVAVMREQKGHGSLERTVTLKTTVEKSPRLLAPQTCRAGVKK